MKRNIIYSQYLKRYFDFLLSLFLIIILAPLFIIISFFVMIIHGFPILFIQKRPGMNEKVFNIIKFRTMKNSSNKNEKIENDKLRLTKFGKFLRSTSLDELPSLINILKGDMSFVGPRPLLVEYLKLYDNNQKKRHLVRPGLTGLAQVNGRNQITWEKKLEYDVKYINEISFFLDLKIFLKTFIVVFRRLGINSVNSVTVEKFKGNEKIEEKE